jgi:hypothetical protein
MMSDSTSWLRGEESNPYSLNQNQLSYRLNDPGSVARVTVSDGGGPQPGVPAVASPAVMGSLIKKRRKRMRKKKHKKMLRRTRHQRRK